jgi:putative transposase
LVDTQGLLIRVKVLAANITDRDGAAILLTSLVGHLPRLLVIWADSGYQGKFEAWVNQLLGGVRLEIVNHPWTGIKGTYAPVGEKVDWDKIIPKGFHLLPRRWLIERTNAWITHSRRLSRDFEGTHTSSEAFIYLAMSKLMVSRLAHQHP